MFEEARLLGSTEKSIRLQTRKGADIPNLIELEPGERERRVYQSLLRRFGQHWIERKPATGVYNCAGHVWASRRTSILDEQAWRQILEDDGYRRLNDGESPCPGDLVLYIDKARNDYLHVGEVLRLRRGFAEGAARIPSILSKWNSTTGEAIHNVLDVPYSQQGYDVHIEFWTDRPVEDT